MNNQKLQLNVMCQVLELRQARLVDIQRATKKPPSQLLRLISSMVAKGLLEVRQDGSSRRKVYVVTPKGEQALPKIKAVLELLANNSPN